MQVKIGRFFIYATLIIGSIVFIFPFAWMLSTSLKVREQLLVFPPIWIPNPVRFANYIDAINYIPFFIYTKNTLYVCTLSVVGITLSSSLVAYGFARIDWPGRDTFFIITLSTMMIPFPVTMVPLYIVFMNLGWIGSFKPLWVPYWFSNAFNIFLLRQFFMTIPTELSDAARIDGCSELGIWGRLIIPLSKPALAVVALFQFMFSWRDFLAPLIFLTKQKMFTLSLGLQFYQSQHGGTEWHMLMAASTMVILPVIILFFLTQRTFIQGITLTGLKG